MSLPEEVNLCSLVTAMTDDEANDGVELEAQWLLRQSKRTQQDWTI